MRRWVPFVAVAAANCINIPVMRQRELIDGIIVTDKDGNDLAKSKVWSSVPNLHIKKSIHPPPSSNVVIAASNSITLLL